MSDRQVSQSSQDPIQPAQLTSVDSQFSLPGEAHEPPRNMFEPCVQTNRIIEYSFSQEPDDKFSCAAALLPGTGLRIPLSERLRLLIKPYDRGKRLNDSSVLAHCSPDKPTDLRIDAIGHGIADKLIQSEEGRPHAFHYFSRALKLAETRYTVTHFESLAIVYSGIKLSCYLHGINFVIKSDHRALCYLMKVKDPCARLARLALMLQESTFEIEYSSNKTHADIDCLSRSPIPAEPGDDTLIDFPFYGLGFENKKVDLLDPSPIDSVADIISAQQSDSFCARYRDLLLRGNERLVVRRAQNFVVVYDTIYWIDRSSDEKKYLLVISVEIVLLILETCHDKHGHFGVYKTYSSIKSRFFWRSMFETVKDYVVFCSECQKSKVSAHKSTGLYQPIPVAHRLFGTFSNDLLGPVPESDGYKYCLCMVDQLSHMQLIEPPREGVLEVMKIRVFLRFGFQTKVITDRGLNLSGQFPTDYYHRFDIAVARTTSFHPQSNGMVESMNRLIGHPLAIFWSSQRERHKYCPFVEFCYNTTPNVTTGMSSYCTVYKQEARVPADDITGRLNLQVCQPSEAQRKADLFADQLALTCRTAQVTHVLSPDKRESMTDANQTQFEFKEGDLELVPQSQLRLLYEGKFKSRHTCPCILVRWLSLCSFLLLILLVIFTAIEWQGKGRQYENDSMNACPMQRHALQERGLQSRDLMSKMVDHRYTNHDINEANHEINVNFNDIEADHRFTNHNIDSGNDDHNSNDGLVSTDQGEYDVGSEPDYTPLGDIVSRPTTPIFEKADKNCGTADTVCKFC